MNLSDTPAHGLRDVTLFPTPSAQHPAGTGHDELRARFLRAGREAVDDRELVQLLLAGSHPAAEAETLAALLLDTFGSPARVLAARPEMPVRHAGLGTGLACREPAAQGPSQSRTGCWRSTRPPGTADAPGGAVERQRPTRPRDRPSPWERWR